MSGDTADKQWQEVTRLFLAACELEQEARQAYLDEACGDDSALRAEVEKLLAADSQAGEFLEDRASKGDGGTAPAELVGQKVGRYTLVRELGSGGMGVVYEAIQDQTEQTVALKIMKPGTVASSAMRRFQFESKVLGRLRHPGIARVYEAGTYRAGPLSVPYFVLEYLPNALTISEYCHKQQLGPRQRLALFASVCDAVEHGHKRGIIHRDLKPGNILVDAEGAPKVIDFGIARSTETDLATMHTATGDLVGTLQYMSPEQVSGDPADPDTRSDVYSLGVVLYQLLTGALPYDVAGTTLDKAVRAIREDPPRRFVGVERPCRGDPETITLTALHKERERRYQSAAELAADVRRYLDGEPIRARIGWGYRFRKWLWKYKWPTGIAATFFVILAGATLMLWSAERGLRRRNYVMAVSLAQAAYKERNVARMRQLLEDCPPSLRGWEWDRLDYLSDRSIEKIEANQGRVLSVAFSPDGTRLLTGGSDGSVKLWDWPAGRETHAWSAHEGPVRMVALNPKGGYAASGDTDGSICVWDVAAGALAYPCLPAHVGPVNDLAFAPDGNRLASCGFDAFIRLWDPATGRLHNEETDSTNGTLTVAFDASGRRIASSGQHRPSITIWDSADLKPLVTIPNDDNIHTLRFAPSGDILWSIHSDGRLCVWGATGDKPGGCHPAHEQCAEALAIGPDGAIIATGATDGTIKLWDARLLTAATDPAGQPNESTILHGHTHAVRSLAISSGGNWLASGSDDGTVRIWSTDSVPETMLLSGGYQGAQRVEFSRDGSLLLCLWAGSSVELLDAHTGDVVRCLGARTSRINDATFTTDGKYVITGSQDQTVRTLNATTGDTRILHRHDGRVDVVAYDGARGHVVSYGIDATIRVSDLGTGREVRTIGHAGGACPVLAVSPDGQYLASGTDEGMMVLWDAGSGEPIRRIAAHAGVVSWLAFDPHGRLISGGQDQTIRMWNPGTGRELWSQPGHTGQVSCGAVSPNGRRLITGSSDGTVKLWNVENGDALMTLHEGTARVMTVAFSPDGKTIGCGDRDGVVRIWETQVPPPEVRKEKRTILEARRLLNTGWNASHFGAEVIRGLEGDETLSEEVRTAAIRLAEVRDMEPFRLANQAWKIAELPGRPPEAYERAYRMARQACALAPDSTDFLNNRGAAEYRTGRFEEASRSLAEAVRRRGEPQDYLFLAMTLAKLGREAQAVENLERARQMLRTQPDEYAGHGWLSRLRMEAELLIEEESPLNRSGDRAR